MVPVLDQEDEAADHGRDGAQPGVVLRRVLGGRGQQLHHRAQGPGRAEDRRLLRHAALGVGKAVRVVPAQDHVNVGQVARDVADAHGADGDHVAEQLRDLGLAAARHGGRLVAVDRLSDGAADVPALLPQLAPQGELVAGRVHIDRVGHQEGLAAGPGHPPAVDARHRVLRHVNDVRELVVNGEALRLDDRDQVAKQSHSLLEAVRLRQRTAAIEVVVRAQHPHVRGELAAPAEAGPSQGAPGVLLLGAKKVGGEAELRLHLLLAIAEVVVRQQRHEQPFAGPDADLEGAPVVVAFVRRLPGHAVAPLALGGVVPLRQAELLLRQLFQVRGEDDAAGVPTPVVYIQR
mmetsp:Transcript_95280/g.264842  ORF Transcript_95280/g.264842 Transcript_95280/m.264842 type:complete len:347 (+) Transcript_95280:1903-2943(+)